MHQSRSMRVDRKVEKWAHCSNETEYLMDYGISGILGRKSSDLMVEYYY